MFARAQRSTPKTAASAKGAPSRGLSARPANGASGVLLERTPSSMARASEGSLLAAKLAQLQGAISDKENELAEACGADDLSVMRQMMTLG